MDKNSLEVGGKLHPQVCFEGQSPADFGRQAPGIGDFSLCLMPHSLKLHPVYEDGLGVGCWGTFARGLIFT